MPAPLAERLKQNPATIAEHYEGVTVMFADVVDFTPLSADLVPYELVRQDFLCEPRGTIAVKGKGHMEVWHVVGRR